MTQRVFPFRFQFTHPGKGATVLPIRHAHPHGFNSRTLGRVRPTTRFLTSSPTLFQFTHPGKGATKFPTLNGTTNQSFNSRTLGRVRLHASCTTSRQRGFNSRTLGRVRPEPLIKNSPSLMFQFTHPGKGATIPIISPRTTTASFNSRTLGRVRQCGAKLRIIGRINKRNLRLGVLS